MEELSSCATYLSGKMVIYHRWVSFKKIIRKNLLIILIRDIIYKEKYTKLCILNNNNNKKNNNIQQVHNNNNNNNNNKNNSNNCRDTILEPKPKV